VAKRALARKTGARGLRSILEQVLLDTMYELPTLENVSKVVVDEQMISATASRFSSTPTVTRLPAAAPHSFPSGRGAGRSSQHYTLHLVRIPRCSVRSLRVRFDH